MHQNAIIDANTKLRQKNIRGNLFNPGLAPANGRATLKTEQPAPVGKVRQARILVVEDDAFLRDGLQDLLESVDSAEAGYTFQVDTAANGQVGLERLAQQQPDLIISDVAMPQMDGCQFLEQVRCNPAWAHIPFIFLTARRECPEIQAARRSGTVHYLTKPYTFDEFLALIVDQLNR
jgi:CheY-like chemotaxis protein